MGLAQSTPGHWTRRSPFFVAPSLPFSQRCDNPLENCVFFFWFCVCFVVFPPPPFFSFVHANKWTCSYGVAVEMLRWFDTSTAPRRRPTACDGRSEEHLRVECEKDKYGVFQWRETEISSRVCFSSSAQLPLSPSFFFPLPSSHSPSSISCSSSAFYLWLVRRRRPARRDGIDRSHAAPLSSSTRHYVVVDTTRPGRSHNWLFFFRFRDSLQGPSTRTMCSDDSKLIAIISSLSHLQFSLSSLWHLPALPVVRL